MDLFLTWLSTYSFPVVVLLVLCAGLVFVLKIVTEKAIEKGFDRHAKDIELQLQRRSNFAERVVLDQYVLAREIIEKLNRVLTDLNRHRPGQEVAGLIEKDEVVPLTEIFVQIQNNRFLLPVQIAALLEQYAALILDISNQSGPLSDRANDVIAMRAQIDSAMTEAFRLHEIT